MSNIPEYMTVISPLLSNKIDEICNMISSNLKDIKTSTDLLDKKVSNLEKNFSNLETKIKIIENNQNILKLISNDYWEETH
uniref:Uncharacterized protein n=1 Tax=viral metagenome TaxID=1070528 RepID=A0A6C0B5K0_9ZZZZ|tara:strand:- start:173 stop:415 length:243 start_codon:yes stop_codon:yes gene_type:complete